MGVLVMSNGDLLRQLFRAYAKHDTTVFHSIAEAIIREERSKNHRLLADDLEKILLNGNGQSPDRRFSPIGYDIPKDRERGFPLLDVAQYDYTWERLIAESKTLKPLQQITEEYYHREVLASAGLKPTQRVLFYGPPGCGKTLAAKIFSSVLSYPLVTVRFDAVVSSLLGETAANLRRVFEFIQRGQWVVLFDEFDAIGKDRDNPFEHGELKRVVNSLLQLMDAFQGESLLIAATNHEGLLDDAIWRRFEAVIRFPHPRQQDRVLMLRHFLRGFNSTALNPETIARRLKGATGADIERIAVEAARRAVLAHRSSLLMEDIEPALVNFHERLSVVSSLKGHFLIAQEPGISQSKTKPSDHSTTSVDSVQNIPDVDEDGE